MKPVDLYSALLHIRPFREADLDSCIRFREQVFAIDEAPTAVERWLKWTIDSYYELAKLGQPPYADYAIDLRDSGAFVGSIGIVPTVLPWGALRRDVIGRSAPPGNRIILGHLARISQTWLCRRGGKRAAGVFVSGTSDKAGGRDNRIRQHCLAWDYEDAGNELAA